MLTAIQIELPGNVAEPRFQLFQKITYKGRNYTIVGVAWVSEAESLANGFREWGWSYTLSFLHGAPIQSAFNCSGETLLTFVFECQLIGSE